MNWFFPQKATRAVRCGRIRFAASDFLSTVLGLLPFWWRAAYLDNGLPCHRSTPKTFHVFQFNSPSRYHHYKWTVLEWLNSRDGVSFPPLWTAPLINWYLKERMESSNSSPSFSVSFVMIYGIMRSCTKSSRGEPSKCIVISEPSEPLTGADSSTGSTFRRFTIHVESYACNEAMLVAHNYLKSPHDDFYRLEARTSSIGRGTQPTSHIVSTVLSPTACSCNGFFTSLSTQNGVMKFDT